MKNPKGFIFSDHSHEQLKRRELTKSTVIDIINSPAKIIKEKGEVIVFQKIVKENNKSYLYRVFVNKKKTPPIVITAYKTSKLDKYENKV